MNVYLRELRAYRKSLIIWCVCIIFFVVSGMGKYTAIYSGMNSPTDFLASMPKSLQALMGGGAFDLSKAVEYFGSIFLYLIFMATIHAVMLGSGIISKEESDKTTEFLMVKPVSRSRIITAKLFAAVTNIIVFNLTTLISSIAIVGKYSKGEAVGGDIARLMVGMLLLQLLFMSIGVAFAAASKNFRATGGVSTGILLITFIMSMVIDMNENLEGLKYITPFKYFDAKTLLVGEGFNPVLVLLTVAMIAGLTVLAYVRYNKRDLGH
ncbi:MAG: ABC transporter permease [Clostridia bacterium]|nr:ABC transporter permease [Clostridia bacterium]